MQYFKKYLRVAPLSLAIWRSLEAEALSKYKLKPPTLDIGCGFGEFAGVFFHSFVEAGVDISSTDLFLAAQKKKYKKLVLADARNLPFKDSSFNSVVSISTLEHIKDNDKVFKEVFRVLKNGGYFIFTISTDTLDKSLFFPGPRRRWNKIYNWAFKHHVVIPTKDWLKKATKAGFKIEEWHGTISRFQLFFFQMGLLAAVPSQILRLIFKKRFISGSNFKINLYSILFAKILARPNNTDINIIVVAHKK